MIIYTYFLVALHFIALGYNAGKNNQETLETLLSFFLYLPVFGRVFNWW